MVKPARRAAGWAARRAARRAARKAARAGGRGRGAAASMGAQLSGWATRRTGTTRRGGRTRTKGRRSRTRRRRFEQPPPPPPFYCIAPHTQFATRQRNNINYKLFAAAADGCLDCARRMIEDGDVDPFAESDNYHYNALEYAVHARITRNVNTWAIEQYLEDLGLAITRVGPGR